MKTEKRKRPRPAALDVLIILLIVLCFVGIGIRIAVGDDGLFRSDDSGSFTVSFKVNQKTSEYNSYFKSGTQFYLENGELFGMVSGETQSLPSTLYSENSKGEFVSSHADDGTVDIQGTIATEGTMTDGGLLLPSGDYIVPNMTVSVSSSDVTVEMLITAVNADQ